MSNTKKVWTIHRKKIKSVNRNTKAQTLYLSDFKSTVFEKSKKLKETVNKTKGNQENDASPNNIN